MGLTYKAIGWNRQKRRYDLFMLGGILLYMALYSGLQLVLFPDVTLETVIIRATGTLAFFMLHVILAIGPLCRLNRKFLPLLYNRRHLGVTMFLVSLVHGIFNLMQFHALGNKNPILAIFTSNTHYDSLLRFPFQALGFGALVILFLMAVTSHDFWLKNLTARVWKGLHMMVYLAYALILMHVMLGAYQNESSFGFMAVFGAGLIILLALHLIAGFRQAASDKPLVLAEWVDVGQAYDIPEDRARIMTIGAQNIAVFRYDGRISAIANVCKHQGGPLGEGRVIDGCVTCPWHGYQYEPRNGQSPPPFKEKVVTYSVEIRDGRVWVNPEPHPEGTELEPAVIESNG